MMNKKQIGGLAALMSLALPFVASAQDAAPANPVNSGDVSWMVVSTALVLLMTPGLAFFYAGMVRAKNAVATAMQSFIAIPVMTVLWFVVGYSLAFSPGNAFIGGLDWMFFRNVGAAPNADYAATIPHVLFALFQCMFAIITPALITGAFAERMKFKSYLAFSILWSLAIYIPVAHWVWGMGGWLRNDGALDFAGGLVVHQTAGFSAIAAAIILGRRRESVPLQPNNILFVLLGTGLLWFGWFGFNAGSALSSGELAVTALTNTHLGACAAAIAWMLIDWVNKGKPGLVGACIGAVAGLVAVTPAAGFVTPMSALFIGLVSGAVCNLVATLRAKTKLDDTLDVFACHGVGGLIGALLTGLLADPTINSAAPAGSVALLFTQLKGTVVVALYSVVVTAVILKVVDVVFGLRPSPELEDKGLDLAEHEEVAYQHGPR